MEISEYGPTRGLFLTGGYQKSFVSIRTTDLSKYSPGDLEHVGWYYLPIWKKAPVWTPPYNNVSLRQKMLSYSMPIYRNEKLLGVVGLDLSLAIIENVQRSDLSIMEEAEAYDSLMKDFNYTQQDVANFVGKSRSHIANIIRLLELPQEVVEVVMSKPISYLRKNKDTAERVKSLKDKLKELKKFDPIKYTEEIINKL